VILPQNEGTAVNSALCGFLFCGGLLLKSGGKPAALHKGDLAANGVN
jgi:hypothetical protein